MTYTIRFAPSVRKDWRRLPAAMTEQIQDVLLALGNNPYPTGCKKIRGYDHYFRIKIGKQYRIVYEVADAIRIVIIVRIRHRKDVYRGL